jgi:hypothetical protein
MDHFEYQSARRSDARWGVRVAARGAVHDRATDDLHRIDGRRSTGQRYPTPAELNKTTRQQRDEVPREQLRSTVRAAASQAIDEQDFRNRLRAFGVFVRPRSSTTQLTGYAVALPDDHNAAGDTIWYSGATLATDLSLPRLHHYWRSP